MAAWATAGRTPVRLRMPTAKSSAVIPMAEARITISLRKASRRVEERRAGGSEATKTPFPRRTCTYPSRFRSSMVRATVLGLMPRKRANSRMLGSAWSLGNPPPSM